MLEIKDGEKWARCPICNAVWDTGSMLGSWYFRWHVKDSDLPPAELPQKLCPEHVEEIVLAGRRKGIKRSLYQDQLNEIKKNGLHCPVCRSEDLQWENEMEVRTDLEEVVWTCNHCHAFIILGVRFKNEDENGRHFQPCPFQGSADLHGHLLDILHRDVENHK